MMEEIGKGRLLIKQPNLLICLHLQSADVVWIWLNQRLILFQPFELGYQVRFYFEILKPQAANILRHALYAVPLFSYFITRRATLGEGG
jgi:hypothetical protein